MGLFDFFKKKPAKKSAVVEEVIPPSEAAAPNPALLAQSAPPPRGRAWALPVSVDASNVRLIQSKYIAFDVETTGLDATYDRIIEIGAVLFVDGQPIDTFSSLVNPGKRVPSSATAVNHITNEMLASAPTELEVYPGLIEFLGNAINGETIMCAHNARFDFKFLCNTLSRLGYNAKFQYIDTLRLSRTHIKGLVNYKQGTLEHYFGFVNETAHRAASDAENCGKILYQVLDHAVFTPETQYDFGDSEGYKYWSKGEDARLDGKLDDALRLFDKARNAGYKHPALYESYAKVYRKQKAFENEILILEEAVQCVGAPKTKYFENRKEKALALLNAQRKKESTLQQKALEKARKAEDRRQQKEIEAAKPKKPIGRSIIQYSDDGTVIKEFESVAAASKEVGVTTKCIRDAAVGRQRHAGGYCWKYADTNITNAEND